MRTWFSIVGVLLMQNAIMADEPSSKLPLPDSLVALDSAEGAKRLEGCAARKSFLSLVSYFETQENLAYCGPASAVCVLNASGIARPVSSAHGKYRLFTQSNFFTPAVEKVIPASTVRRIGMTLRQLGDTLSAHGVKVQTIHATESRLDDFRREAVDLLKSGEGFVLVNYLRRSIGQQSGGHISPIGAYHASSDSFLVLDVSKYKYPPVWVPSKDLWRAMREVDSASGKSRGYILLSKDTSKQN